MFPEVIASHEHRETNPEVPYFFEDLSRRMMNDFNVFQAEQNPVMRLPKTSEQIRYVLNQYSEFPATIVSFLSEARNRATAGGWSEAAQELKRNIAEERGSETEGVSHYDILAEGLAKDFGLDVRIAEIKPATRDFLESVRGELQHQDLEHVLGSTYALESSAVPELRIIHALAHELSEKSGQQISEKLHEFFKRHLCEWEPGHEEGLRLATASRLDREVSRDSFRQGFLAVISQMERWWKQLAEESPKATP